MIYFICISVGRVNCTYFQVVNSKPSVLRTVDKTRPAVSTANRQKKGGICSHSDFHFDMIYDRRFDMTAKI